MRVSFCVLTLGACLCGCGSPQEAAKRDAPPDAVTPTESVTKPVDITLTDAHRATLEAADLYDGTEDQTISECARCALVMPGEEAYSSHVGEYDLHFCGESCKVGFDGDPAQGIADIQTVLDADR